MSPPTIPDETINAVHQVGPTAFAVLCKLLVHRNRENGDCYPSVDTIAGAVGLNRKSVLRAVAKLETAGWISVVRSARRGQRGQNRYSICPRHLRAPEGNGPKIGPFSPGNGPILPQGMVPFCPGNGPKKGLEPLLSNPKEENPSSSSTKLRFADQDRSTAEWMFARILEMHPGHRQPNLDAWSDIIRLMRERDHRTDADIRSLFAWANEDDFWASNILCPKTLRKQWDKLTIQRKAKRNGSGQPNSTSEPARIRQRDYSHRS